MVIVSSNMLVVSVSVRGMVASVATVVALSVARFPTDQDLPPMLFALLLLLLLHRVSSEVLIVD